MRVEPVKLGGPTLFPTFIANVIKSPTSLYLVRIHHIIS